MSKVKSGKFIKNVDNKILKFIEENEIDDESINNLVMDYMLYDGFAVSVIMEDDKIKQLSYLPYNKLRVAKPEENKPKHYWFSNDWSHYMEPVNKPVPFIDYSEKDSIKANIFVMRYSPIQ